MDERGRGEGVGYDSQLRPSSPVLPMRQPLRKPSCPFRSWKITKEIERDFLHRYGRRENSDDPTEESVKIDPILLTEFEQLIKT